MDIVIKSRTIQGKNFQTICIFSDFKLMIIQGNNMSCMFYTCITLFKAFTILLYKIKNKLYRKEKLVLK